MSSLTQNAFLLLNKANTGSFQRQPLLALVAETPAKIGFWLMRFFSGLKKPLLRQTELGS